MNFRFATVLKAFLVLALFMGVIYFQRTYDSIKKTVANAEAASPPSWLVKSFDLGLHSALASFFWINTRTELPFFREGYEKFYNDLNLILKLDPKFSTPYSYTVLVLPNTRYPDKINTALSIGEAGLQNADPDWQIPFYMAAIYELYLGNTTDAIKYFDTAASTPGIPDVVRRYAINFGIFPNRREEAKQIWITIYLNAPDELTKEHAKEQIEHLAIIDFLQGAVNTYKQKFGLYPSQIQDLINQKIITGIPPDPFGFQFDLYEGGSVVGIKQPTTY